MSPRGDICVHMCVRTCARVRARVTSRLKHPLKIFTNPLDEYTLCTRQNLELMSYGSISFCFNLHVTWHDETRAMVQFNRERRISLTRGGTWLYLIRRRFILKMI